MAKEAYRKFYLQTTSGDKFEIAELDFNHIKSRIATGRTNGWYVQRGPSMGDRCDWRLAFKDVAGVWSDKDEKKDVIIRDEVIDIEKRLPPKVGKKEAPAKPKCNCNWSDPNKYEFVTQIVGGVNRYFKQCNKCDSKSTLIKKREVELAMEAKGMTIDDVPLIG